jgi:hypothetical protein
MDERSAAEELPALYRALLDRIAQIDAAGLERSDIAFDPGDVIYSRAWDDRAPRPEDLPGRPPRSLSCERSAAPCRTAPLA